MKKQLMAVLCVAALTLPAASAQAVNIKVNGTMEFIQQMDHNVDLGYAFQDSADAWHNLGPEMGAYHQKHFRAAQRFIPVFTFEISENLMAVYDCIAGFFTWGGPSSGVQPYAQMNGGALGTRSNNITTRSAYLDWVVPNTKIKIRMGLQNFYMPSFASGFTPIKGEFGTGIVVNAPVTDKIALTAFWQRAASGPRRGVSEGYPSSVYADDTMDFFALHLPVTGNGWRFAPQLGLGIIGKDSNTAKIAYNGDRATFMGQRLRAGMAGGPDDSTYVPVLAAAAQANLRNGTTHQSGEIITLYAALGGEIVKWDPLRIAVDFGWGGNRVDHKEFSRSGWYAGFKGSYKTKWGVPTIQGWYASGDDSDIYNGSERIAAGAVGATNASLLSASYLSNAMYSFEKGYLVGTWGFSLQWNNIVFIEKLFNSIRFAYYRGTNSPAMAPYARQGLSGGFTRLSYGNPYFSLQQPGVPSSVIYYLTRNDSLMEIDVDAVYSLYKNLAAMVELNYIIAQLDGKTWGADLNDGQGFRKAKFSDSWRVAFCLRYVF